MNDAVRAALTDLFAHLIENDETWVVQLRRDGAAQPPYVQGARDDDDTLVVEVSNDDIHDPKLTAMQLAGLAALGWRKPGTESPNYSREYAADADVDEVATLIVTTMATALGFTDGDAVEVEVFASDFTDVIDAHPDLPIV